MRTIKLKYLVAIITGVLLILLVSYIFGLIIGARQAFADEISDTQAIRAIIGEAADQGAFGMECVATAIINRGALKGVYGANAKHIDKQPAWVFKMAQEAYYRAKTAFKNGNAIHKGDHWENTKAFGTPYWVKSMVLVYEYKDHKFYKAKQ